jgi:hypothetical protein
MNLPRALELAQVLAAAIAIPPSDLVNRAGTVIKVGATDFNVITTIYASDLATDMNPDRGLAEVSIGLIVQAANTGDVVIAIRGTQGILEWIHDFEFLQVPCPFLPGAGHTDDGFTAMYLSLSTGPRAGSPSVVKALPTLPFTPPLTSLTICGHSLGGALATYLALDVAANSPFHDPIAYTFASPRTGDALFASTFDQVVTASERIANRLDLVPQLPPPPAYEHVEKFYGLNPVRFLPPPPKILVQSTIPCEHAINTYLYLLSLDAGGPVIPLDPVCAP